MLNIKMPRVDHKDLARVGSYSALTESKHVTGRGKGRVNPRIGQSRQANQQVMAINYSNRDTILLLRQSQR